MQTLHENSLKEITGGMNPGTGGPMDSFARDAGQFVGGATGWAQSNPFTYFVLGPGIGGFVGMYYGLSAAWN